ncbi:serine/threonine protein kinase [Frankia sp. CNm7]|uniref:Serine/threonine protein kinase n=1 Tax=Frankia nepalensis TaxID=1836974 RepID=A0A937RKG9_9ACTN|nr:serine/threonine protein kinase [Frankia nepalensis]MBL7512909.1 serine/threonine protein kinase [Frankia nepalensis]MBL7519961.1 serine/threonine protein kinase [Frankia nepalensis]MBL7628088.1 serine/threonine protein kinase [Frankia nepalensis]
MPGLPNVAPLEPADPRTVGSYRMLGRLAKGGMGTVYLARPANGGPLVAIKMIDADLARMPAFRERFRREAMAAQRVARFCTAEVLDVEVSGPRPYLVTEFIDGPTLTVAVTERGPLPPAELERFAVAVASALTAIHAAGVVHRDLKPGNILLSPSGARVIDFGVCRPVDDADATAITWGRLGTPVFMAPEQAIDQPASAASDIHAWGGIMIFAATGRLPFGDPQLDELLRRILQDTPDVTGLPAQLRPMVARALAKNPASRPTARELLLWLTDATGPSADDTRLLPRGFATLTPPPPASPPLTRPSFPPPTAADTGHRAGTRAAGPPVTDQPPTRPRPRLFRRPPH